MHSNDMSLTQEGQAGALSHLLTQGADPSLTDRTGRTGELFAMEISLKSTKSLISCTPPHTKGVTCNSVYIELHTDYF